MIIDCQGCPVRGRGCADCVVNLLLPESPGAGLGDTEIEPVVRQAIDLFAEAGMLPRPHLVSSRTEPVRRSRARPRRRTA